MTSYAPYASLGGAPRGAQFAGRRIIALDCVDSTNTDVFEHGREGVVAIAGRQTAGCGKQGRTWNRARSFRGVLTHLGGKVMLLRSGGLDRVWRAWADARALTVRSIRSGAASGVVQSIDEFRALGVETPEGTRRAMPGEIEVLNGA